MPNLLCIAFCIVQFTNLTSLKQLITFDGRLQWGHLHLSNKQLVKIISTLPPPWCSPKCYYLSHVASLKWWDLVRTLMCKCVAIGTAASITPQRHHSAKAKTKNNNNNKKITLKNKMKTNKQKTPKGSKEKVQRTCGVWPRTAGYAWLRNSAGDA